MLKKILLATFLTLSIPAFAETYTPQTPDCSKNVSYIQKLTDDGFIPLMNEQDILHKDVKHILAYNPKTHESVLLTNLADKEVCIDFIGAGLKVTHDIDTLRKFLNDSINNEKTETP